MLAARLVRTVIERRRRALVRIAYPQRSVEVPRGWSVLEASRGFSIPHMSMCGGNARCSTCRVRVLAGGANCPAPEAMEQRTLERIHAPADVRLACQLRPRGDVTLVPLLDATRHEAPLTAQIAEREIALLVVRVVEWRPIRGARPTPHDLAYALDRLHAVIGAAVTTAGAFDVAYDHCGARASFGLTSDLANASREAVSAARVIDDGLVDLDKRLAREVGFVADVALVVHAGPAVVGPLGHGNERARSVFGDAVGIAQRLAERAAAERARFTITRAASDAAALTIEAERWHLAPGSTVEIATADRVP
jgi:adenylate cyclase